MAPYTYSDITPLRLTGMQYVSTDASANPTPIYSSEINWYHAGYTVKQKTKKELQEIRSKILLQDSWNITKEIALKRYQLIKSVKPITNKVNYNPKIRQR